MKQPNVKKDAWLTQKSTLYNDNEINENSISNEDSEAATVKGKKHQDKDMDQSMNDSFLNTPQKVKSSNKQQIQHAVTFNEDYDNSVEPFMKVDGTAQKIATMAE